MTPAIQYGVEMGHHAGRYSTSISSVGADNRRFDSESTFDNRNNQVSTNLDLPMNQSTNETPSACFQSNRYTPHGHQPTAHGFSKLPLKPY